MGRGPKPVRVSVLMLDPDQQLPIKSCTQMGFGKLPMLPGLQGLLLSDTLCTMQSVHRERAGVSEVHTASQNWPTCSSQKSWTESSRRPATSFFQGSCTSCSAVPRPQVRKRRQPLPIGQENARPLVPCQAGINATAVSCHPGGVAAWCAMESAGMLAASLGSGQTT